MPVAPGRLRCAKLRAVSAPTVWNSVSVCARATPGANSSYANAGMLAAWRSVCSMACIATLQRERGAPLSHW